MKKCLVWLFCGLGLVCSGHQVLSAPKLPLLENDKVSNKLFGVFKASHDILKENTRWVDGKYELHLLSALLGVNQKVSSEQYSTALDMIFSMIAEKQDTLRLVLDSPGGLLVVGEAFYDAIDKYADQLEYRAHLPEGSYCASACAMIYLYIEKRTCTLGSKVGFHGAHIFGRYSESGTSRMLIGVLMRPGSKAPKPFILELYLQDDAFSTVEMTDKLCSQLVGKDIASYYLGEQD